MDIATRLGVQTQAAAQAGKTLPSEKDKITTPDSPVITGEKKSAGMNPLQLISHLLRGNTQESSRIIDFDNAIDVQQEQERVQKKAKKGTEPNEVDQQRLKLLKNIGQFNKVHGDLEEIRGGLQPESKEALQLQARQRAVREMKNNLVMKYESLDGRLQNTAELYASDTGNNPWQIKHPL